MSVRYARGGGLSPGALPQVMLPRLPPGWERKWFEHLIVAKNKVAKVLLRLGFSYGYTVDINYQKAVHGISPNGAITLRARVVRWSDGTRYQPVPNRQRHHGMIETGGQRPRTDWQEGTMYSGGGAGNPTPTASPRADLRGVHTGEFPLGDPAGASQRHADTVLRILDAAVQIFGVLKGRR